MRSTFATKVRIWRQQQRDHIQERILQVSNQYCNVFKIYLQRARSGTNFALGSLSTITGIAGGVVTGLDGSRILAGISGALSGVKAEFNQAYFLNLAMPVITKGIELRRKQVYDDAVLHGQRLSYSQYDVESAIKDAITYHGACSIQSAFETAEESIETVENPGLEAAHRTIIQVNAISREMNQKTVDLKSYRKVRKLGYLEAGKPLPEDGTATKPTMPLTGIVTAIDAVRVATTTSQTRFDSAPSLKAIENAVEMLDASLAKANLAMLDKVNTCKESAKKTTNEYYEMQAVLAAEVTNDGRKLKQAEVDIKRDKATEVQTVIESVVARYQNALDLLLGELLADKVDSAALNVANTKFEESVTAIGGCLPPSAPQ